MMRRRVATLGRLSMAAGTLLMVVGLSIRAGAIAAVTGAEPTSSFVPPPTASTAPGAPSPTSSVAPSGPLPSPPPASSTPAPSTVTFFDDGFDVEGAWPTGELGDLTAAYEAGQLVISGPPADLPVYIAPVAEPLGSAATVVVEADLTLSPGTQAGVYVGSADGERVAALIDSDGRVTIVRDTTVSLDVIGSGSVALREQARLTLTLDDVSVVVDVTGQPAVSVALPARAVDFGLVTWPTEDSRVSVARFRVMASPGSP